MLSSYLCCLVCKDVTENRMSLFVLEGVAKEEEEEEEEESHESQK